MDVGNLEWGCCIAGWEECCYAMSTSLYILETDAVDDNHSPAAAMSFRGKKRGEMVM